MVSLLILMVAILTETFCSVSATECHVIKHVTTEKCEKFNDMKCQNFEGNLKSVDFTQLEGQYEIVSGALDAPLTCHKLNCDNLLVHHDEHPKGGSDLELTLKETGSDNVIHRTKAYFNTSTSIHGEEEHYFDKSLDQWCEAAFTFLQVTPDYFVLQICNKCEKNPDIFSVLVFRKSDSKLKVSEIKTKLPQQVTSLNNFQLTCNNN